jgi:branched-chain amino acid transport system substrate-binding protein
MKGISIALAGAAALAAGSALAQTPVKVGMIVSYTGQFADTGIQLDSGYKLYLKQHGETVAGRKIETIRKDNGGIAPDVAKRLGQEFVVRDKGDIIAGFDLTPNALAVGDVSAEAKKFMVVMNAATSIITTKSPYMARTSSTTPQLNSALGTWAAKNGIKKVYTLVSDFGPGLDAVAAFTENFQAAGGTIVGAAKFPVAALDFSAFIQAAKDTNPDAIYIWTPGGTQPAAIGKALAERGVDTSKIKILGQDELTGVSAISSMGDLSIGIITAAMYDYSHKSALNEKFVKDYQEEYKRMPDIFSIGGYDGATLIYKALEKTGGKSDGESLIAAAKGLSWESPRGTIMIDPETRDIVQTVYIRRVTKVDGKLINVEFDKVDNVKDPVKEKMKAAK